MCSIIQDEDASKIALIREWIKEDRNQKLRAELSKIIPVFQPDILNHYFNLNFGDYTKAGNDVADEEAIKKELNKIMYDCNINDEIFNYEEKAPLLVPVKLLDLRRSKSIRPISGVISNLSDIEEGYPHIRLDMKSGLNSIRAQYSTLRIFEVRIEDNAVINCYEVLGEFLLTATRLQVLKLEIRRKEKGSAFISLMETLKQVRELRNLSLKFIETDLPPDSISFSQKIGELYQLGKLEAFELIFDDCEDLTNSFSEKKLIEALTNLNLHLYAKGNKMKSYTIVVPDFNFDPVDVDEFLATLEKFKTLTVLELRIAIGMNNITSYQKIESLIAQTENLKLLYLELEAKDTSSDPLDAQRFWEILGSKKDLKALLVKFKNFDNFNYSLSALFENLSKVDNLEEFDINLYKESKRNFRIQMSDEEFKKCGAFLSKMKKLEIFKLTVPSMLSFDNLKEMITGTKGLSLLKTFAIDFDTEIQDEGALKKLLKENLPKTCTNIDLELRVSKKKSIPDDLASQKAKDQEIDKIKPLDL